MVFKSFYLRQSVFSNVKHEELILFEYSFCSMQDGFLQPLIHGVQLAADPRY